MDETITDRFESNIDCPTSKILMNTYEMITNKIIEKMKTGQVPWRKPWKFQPPRNLVSKRLYHGINLLLLTLNEFELPYYVTFHQAKQLGGSIKKGEHGTPVVFWKLLETLDKQADNEAEITKVIPYLQYSTVFNLCQTEGIEVPNDAPSTLAPLAVCEEIIAGFTDKPQTIHTLLPKAFYQPETDMIHMPAKTSFVSSEAYYSTLFHEYVHATGHEKRLNRHAPAHTNFDFGSKDYSREELVAELGSAFLCAEAQIDNSVIENNTAYLNSWLKVLQNDQKLIIYASAKAGKAVDYICNQR
jgi:antirestriction protein ArdC